MTWIHDVLIIHPQKYFVKTSETPCWIRPMSHSGLNQGAFRRPTGRARTPDTLFCRQEKDRRGVSSRVISSNLIYWTLQGNLWEPNLSDQFVLCWVNLVQSSVSGPPEPHSEPPFWSFMPIHSKDSAELILSISLHKEIEAGRRKEDSKRLEARVPEGSHPPVHPSELH